MNIIYSNCPKARVVCPHLAASPTHTVETSGLMCLIVSNIAMPRKFKRKHIRNF